MNNNKSRTRGRKAARWGMLALLLTILVAPFSGYLLTDHAQAQTAQQDVNERSEFWREVRQGQSGYSAVQGPETNVLIQNNGQNWRALRNGPIAQYGAWIFGGVVAALFVMLLLY